MYLCKQEHGFSVFLRVCNLDYQVPLRLHIYKSMFRPEVISFFRPCKTSIHFCLYKPCAMCLSLLHFQACAVSEPNCNCCLSNKYTYMQLRSPEVTRVNFHLSVS